MSSSEMSSFEHIKIDPDEPVHASEWNIPVETTMRLRRENFTVLSIHPDSDAVSEEKHLCEEEASETKNLSKASLYRKIDILRAMKDNERFDLIEKIGEGASGRVYNVHDVNCDREIAVKVLKRENTEEATLASLERFIREAAVASNLEHPNIVPVYDLDADEKGRLYLAMRKVHGTTMKQFIQDSANGVKHPHLSTLDDIVRIFLKICDALSFAHSKKLIHQDIKPDNIMIGEYGEVFLIDWGAASCSGDEVSMTPAYMSPQQAKGCEPSPQDDVYCLGATFFHVLYKRLPTKANSMDELWKKKEAGEYTPAAPEECDGIAPQLQSIVEKTLERDIESRYESIDAFAQDLKQYQSGLSVSAYQDTLFDFLMRWYRNHKHTFWSGAAILTVLVSSALLFYNLKLKEIAKWGKPVFTETFHSENWEENWLVKDGSFELKNGRLVNTDARGSVLLFKKELVGNCAFEFEGEILPGSTPGDISVCWYQEIESEKQSMMAQCGAWGNTYSSIHENGEVDFSEAILKTKGINKVRLEFDNGFVFLYLNGERICEYEQPFPSTSGYIGFYLWYSGKAIDNINIYSKGLPEKGPPTQVGDAFYRKKNFSDASAAYDLVLRSVENKKLIDTARYKKVICLLRNEQADAAFSLARELLGTSRDFDVKLLFLNKLFEDKRFFDALMKMEEMHRHANSNQRKQLSIPWGKQLGKVKSPLNKQLLDDYLDLYKRYFSNSPLHDVKLAWTYMHLNEPDAVLEQFQHLPLLCAYATAKKGNHEATLKEYGMFPEIAVPTLVKLNRMQEALEKYPKRIETILGEAERLGNLPQFIRLCKTANPEYAAKALLNMGKFEEALRYDNSSAMKAEIDYYSGNAERLLATESKELKNLRLNALFESGRFKEFEAKQTLTLEVDFKFGHFEKILKDPRGEVQYLNKVYLELGMLNEFKQKAIEYNTQDRLFLLVAFTEALSTGKAFPELKSIDTSIRKFNNYQFTEKVVDEFVMLPLVLELLGEHEKAIEVLDYESEKLKFSCRQFPFHLAAFMTGKTEREQFMNQPDKRFLEADLLLAQGLRAEYSRNQSPVPFYEKYLSIPRHQRRILPFVHYFMRLRIKHHTENGR